jgi:uncharacterized protein (TIGR02444 family)
MSPSSFDLENPFWRFSITVYADKRVATECLALQNVFGADVNVILFCAWRGTQHAALADADLRNITATIKEWHSDVVRPLRSVRQALKTMIEAAPTETTDLRRQIAALEIRSEQIEQAMLYARHRDAGTPSALDAAACASQNIALALRSCGTKDDEVFHIDALIQAAASYEAT